MSTSESAMLPSQFPLLADRVAFVTGGARGMGASHVRALVRQGARVVIGDLLENEGQTLAHELGDRVAFVRHDVTSSSGWADALARAEEVFGPVEILVNNAGILAWNTIEDTSEADYRRLIDVNQVSCFLGMKAVLPSMRRLGRGTIVNVSSVAGFVGWANAIAYTASKFAVRGMTKVAAKEFAPYGIRVNSVHPGMIDTPMTTSTPQSTRLIKSVAAASALGRLGEPEEISSLVVYLVSDQASFITGAAFVADGGFIQ
ncbi:short-chain dehydrogenase [Pandoraea terrae]|uniref:Short-chain dehydrogenase n=1 Tax=Pandoraea terrae TaxID=1537710 RepID=A0A5E4U4U7_9BURK|nr:glucose 1-dehydrogenase [Pandoraea terrae]VVD95106.1 short-chain dehydrogenase [Pandoraea terrae]